jgi:hypothetical protein
MHDLRSAQFHRMQCWQPCLVDALSLLPVPNSRKFIGQYTMPCQAENNNTLGVPRESGDTLGNA